MRKVIYAWINVFVDFYQNFSRDSTWSENEVVQFYRNIKSTKIKKFMLSVE